MMQKGKKFVTSALVSTYGTTVVLHKEGVYRDDRWESDCHDLIFLHIAIFLLLKLGMP